MPFRSDADDGEGGFSVVGLGFAVSGVIVLGAFGVIAATWPEGGSGASVSSGEASVVKTPVVLQALYVLALIALTSQK